jgi:hypothetical protein
MNEGAKKNEDSKEVEETELEATSAELQEQDLDKVVGGRKAGGTNLPY